MPLRNTRQRTFVRENFDAIWPAHLSGFTNLLVQLRKRFDGDLDLVLVLATISSRTQPEEWVPALDQLGRLTRETAPESNQSAINIQSVAEYSGIPRETVRRKVTLLQARGWVDRGADGRLTVTHAAARDLQDETGSTITYLAALLIAFETAQAQAASRNV
ncbi:hypothetical protein VK792_08090 [Mesobacterium sp. TK19101]|uniref:HTH crp-type domain-containing protein n=1 Tax=Mesobacterium hydrothermale TaxID=3111907 RepID=A0ABU6HFL3_9RHOB|nr:hypothetical protein [Mesobacterium sp. TK19101]MEC3861240.1 hypothetical protein [Mesobacterium sp. TK19101]